MKKTYIMLLLWSLSTGAMASSQVGVASWYGKENPKSCTGKTLTHKYPALAHRTFPIGSWVKVTHLKNNKSVTAVVEDRGPYIKGRIVDLNIPAAKQLDLISSGIGRVKIELIKK